jgi:hypothetical protein
MLKYNDTKKDYQYSLYNVSINQYSQKVYNLMINPSIINPTLLISTAIKINKLWTNDHIYSFIENKSDGYEYFFKYKSNKFELYQIKKIQSITFPHGTIFKTNDGISVKMLNDITFTLVNGVRLQFNGKKIIFTNNTHNSIESYIQKFILPIGTCVYLNGNETILNKNLIVMLYDKYKNKIIINKDTIVNYNNIKMIMVNNLVACI